MSPQTEWLRRLETAARMPSINRASDLRQKPARTPTGWSDVIGSHSGSLQSSRFADSCESPSARGANGRFRHCGGGEVISRPAQFSAYGILVQCAVIKIGRASCRERV